MVEKLDAPEPCQALQQPQDPPPSLLGAYLTLMENPKSTHVDQISARTTNKGEGIIERDVLGPFGMHMSAEIYSDLDTPMPYSITNPGSGIRQIFDTAGKETSVDFPILGKNGITDVVANFNTATDSVASESLTFSDLNGSQISHTVYTFGPDGRATSCAVGTSGQPGDQVRVWAIKPE